MSVEKLVYYPPYSLVSILLVSSDSSITSVLSTNALASQSGLKQLLPGPTCTVTVSVASPRIDGKMAVVDRPLSV